MCIRYFTLNKSTNKIFVLQTPNGFNYLYCKTSLIFMINVWYCLSPMFIESIIISINQDFIEINNNWK